MTPEELGKELREGTDPFLRRRRAVVGLELFNVLSMGLIALYQVGLLRHVPEPPLPGFDADRVNGSGQAYAILATPDALLAVGSYAATAGLAAMGAPDRSRTAPWVPLAAAGKALADAAFAVKLLVDQPTKYKTFCLWCVLSALATLAAVPLTLPEAGAAGRRLKGDDDGR